MHALLIVQKAAGEKHSTELVPACINFQDGKTNYWRHIKHHRDPTICISKDTKLPTLK